MLLSVLLLLPKQLCNYSFILYQKFETTCLKTMVICPITSNFFAFYTKKSQTGLLIGFFLIFVFLDRTSLVTTFLFGLQKKQEIVIEKIVRNKHKCVIVVKGLELFGKPVFSQMFMGKMIT
jgi:hypothetical protein